MATTKRTTATTDEPTTLPAEELPAGGSEGNTGPVPISAEDLMTEQEKLGPDPISAPVEPGPLAEPVAVAPREPYPTGSPWVPPTEKVPHNQAPPEVP